MVTGILTGIRVATKRCGNLHPLDLALARTTVPCHRNATPAIPATRARCSWHSQGNRDS